MMDLVSDVNEDVNEDPTLTYLAADRPSVIGAVVVNSEEEPTRIEECDYCGHIPCGCGG